MTIELPDAVADVHVFAVEAAEKHGLTSQHIYTHFCPASDTWPYDEWRITDNFELGYGCMVLRLGVGWFWRNRGNSQSQD
jgi:hypothetical protein